ncbi:hypothetical protein GQ55_2G043900 [Panicum hallii var. hallii]|uniref:Uncharacterized protein n=1 Tax=Panicum hallii var. hallii TaxID=1504633 RepID=A0A2T7ELD5_9POAL|nr:hypothetical protein GQ55_2G043900 [Panicum hallii var. hallii]
MYSVTASATSPSMAKRPFQSSASALMTPPLRPSALSPLRTGTSDATESTAAVAANQASPDPLPACERRPPPRDASTASADTKPTMARRPASHSPGLAALGFGVGVAGAANGVLGGAEEDAALVSSLGSVSPAWALTTRARRRGARAAAGTRTGSTPACAPAMEAITVAAVEVRGPRRREIHGRKRRRESTRASYLVHARDVERGRITASWARALTSTWTPRRSAGCRKVAQDSRTTQERAGDVCAASVSGEWRQGRRSCQAEEEASIIVAGWPCGKCDFNRGVNW